ncbi:MAG TPA: hypothetical protein P5244_08970 [Syntrophales bacterium]|nr:hypothetical protein [Syntrophales bacterium]
MDAKSDEKDKKERRRIEQVVDWLFVPEGGQRCSFLSDADRIQYMECVVDRITDTPEHIQERLMSRWYYRVMNNHKKRELAERLLKRASEQIYARSHLEAWAEAMLRKRQMQITPEAMAVLYAIHSGRGKEMAGVYVRDMQRVKARMASRIKRTGTMEKTARGSTVQKPRYKRTKRQEEAQRKKWMQGHPS